MIGPRVGEPGRGLRVLDGSEGGDTAARHELLLSQENPLPGGHCGTTLAAPLSPHPPHQQHHHDALHNALHTLAWSDINKLQSHLSLLCVRSTIALTSVTLLSLNVTTGLAAAC